MFTNKMNVFLVALLMLVTANTAHANNSTAILSEYQKLAGVSEAEAKKDIEMVTLAIKNELKAGRDVTVKNFGRFYVQDRAARKARNPRTGAEIQVEARRYPRFVSADGFKSEMNTVAVAAAPSPVAVGAAPQDAAPQA